MLRDDWNNGHGRRSAARNYSVNRLKSAHSAHERILSGRLLQYWAGGRWQSHNLRRVREGSVGCVDHRIRDFNVIVSPSTTNVPYPRW
jgi:hypothetical protein